MFEKEIALLYDIRTKNIESDLKAICKLITPMNTLEVGCGSGRILKALHNAGCKNLTGIEIDREKARIAKKRFSKFKNIKIIDDDFLKSKINNSFSRILFAFNVISEFITVKKRIYALTKAKTLLKPRGKIIVISYMHDFQDYAKKQRLHNFEIINNRKWLVQISCKRNQISQISKCQVIYSDSRGHSFSDVYRISLLTRNELLTLYKASGLNLLKEYGDYNLTKIKANSKVMIHVLGSK